ncbi:retrovirus-related pol polyprotein from transposon TNT 1-94 [Tanacetum coccineum]
MDQMNQRIDGLLVFQRISQPVIDHMNNGEGTSHHRGQTAYGRLTKLEFPKFNGEDVQGWLYRVNLFFTIDIIQEDAQKLMLVSMHLFDHALNWHKQFLKRNMDNVTWHQYEEGIKERFDHFNEDPMVKLKNLKQVGSVQAYQDSFEVLLNKMQDATLAIPKSRYTALLSANKAASTPFLSKSGGYAAKSNTLALPTSPQTVVAGYEEEIKDEDSVDSKIDQVVVRKEEVMPQVSLNVMNRVNSYQTMRINGHVGKQVVHMLVDYGSTHNFLDLQDSKRIGCRMNKMCPLQVAVANGQVMSSVYVQEFQVEPARA